MIKKSLLFAAFCAIGFSVQAQSLPSLLIGSDAAGLGRGNATVAAEATAYSVDNNVAAMSLGEDRFAAAASFGLWQPSYANDKIAGAAAMFRPADRWAAGLSFRHLSQPAYDIVSDSGLASRDGTFTPAEFNIALGASYAIAGCLSAGIAARLTRSSLALEASATVPGADVGLYFKLKGISAGLSVNNLGPKVKYDETGYPQPSLLKAGAEYRLGLNTSSVGAAVEADVFFTGVFMAGIGFDYSFKDILCVRAGYHYGNEAKAVPSYASAGFGVKFFGVRLDAACLFCSPVLKNSFCVSLGYSF